MEKYDPTKVEAKWQQYWKDNGTSKIDLDNAKNPYFNLMMFPYPSAEGLHIGGMYTFTGVDTYGRFMRMNGNDVFEPIGLDAFGIHSENYALKIGEHIKTVSQRTEKNFYRQLHLMGNMYDWDRTVETNKPNYYQWTQWLFVQLFKSGLAYRKKATVNFCPTCKTVLSDEQVIDGKCERTGDEVIQKDMEQWFFRITKYADRLSENLKKMDWDEDVKMGQKNWIGKKAGINITYPIKDLEETVTCFTTRPDTNFGMTFMVVAPEHALVKKILAGEIKVSDEIKTKVAAYVKEAAAKTEQDRLTDVRTKTGTFTGLYAINNLNGKEVPIWVADYVLAGFGTGAVVGVPGHDMRDYEFAKAMDLPVVRVVVGADGDKSEITDAKQVQESEGVMINSEFLDGIKIHDAVAKMMDHLEEKGWGKRVISFNLRDWCVSRQRYWGPPIPLIYCEDEAKQGLSWFNTSEEAKKMLSESEIEELAKQMPGWFPDENLPVKLPEVAEFEKIKPDGSGKGPLASQTEFVNTTCPHCGKPAVRETDVSDPFVDSCWYFLRYPFTEYNNIPFGGDFENPKSHYHPEVSADEAKKAIARQKKWGPVTSYIGGKEHTVLHLLYARFITMVFHDLGYLDFEEPFDRFYGHGLITKDGAKMSKSKGNVVNPDEYIAKYGADSIRMYLRFLGPFDKGGDWRDTGMDGMYRFINKLWYIFSEHKENVANNVKIEVKTPVDDSYLHQKVKAITEDLPALKFNTAVAEIMQLLNWYKENESNIPMEKRTEYLTTLALMLAPLAPHLADEFWNSLGHNESVHLQSWPKFDDTKIVADTVEIPVQVNGRVRDTLVIASGAQQPEVEAAALKLENIQKNIGTAAVKKVIYIQGKIINIIV